MNFVRFTLSVCDFENINIKLEHLPSIKLYTLEKLVHFQNTKFMHIFDAESIFCRR